MDIKCFKGDSVYNYDEMVQRIAANKQILWYLKLFYIDELQEESFQEQLTDCCYKCRVREDEAYAMYFASRIPGETCFEKIMEKIEEIEAKEDSTNDKKSK